MAQGAERSTQGAGRRLFTANEVPGGWRVGPFFFFKKKRGYAAATNNAGYPWPATRLSDAEFLPTRSALTSASVKLVKYYYTLDLT
jgi:hypothetical protein